MVQEMTSALSAALGARVRQERQERRWTLDQLALASGVSRRLIVTIERGEANPSIGTLLGISDALGIGLPALVAPPAGAPVVVTRAGEAPVLWTSEAGGQASLLVGTQPPDVLELWDWTLAVGDRHVSQPHAAGTRELLHVLDGVVVVESGDVKQRLLAGDAISFPGDVVHAYRNGSKEPARFSLAVYEPDVAPTTPERRPPDEDRR